MKSVHATNLLLLSALFTLSVVVYSELPERIPVHFGPAGDADRWGERSLLRWLLLPLMAGVLCATLYVAAWFTARDPQHVNMPDKKKLLQLPRDSQLWVLQGITHPLYLIALVLNIAMCLFQYGAYLTAMTLDGRPAILAGLLLALLAGPFSVVGLLLSFQRRMDRAWRQHLGTTGG